MALSSFLAATTLISAVVWRLVTGFSLLKPSLIWVVPIFAIRAFGWLASVFDRPWTVENSEEQSYLDGLLVVVSIPLYNEDPGLLDRCIWALANQSRPPDAIEIVDDCSTIDYTALRVHWEGWHGRTEVRWHTQPVNQGKRRAHCVTFSTYPMADVFITVDSDTTVCLNGIEEGIKPFLDSEVMSVAGIELGFNYSANFLTLLQNSLQQVAQAVVSASWSVTGKMFTNRGPFALYRADLIRPLIPLYFGEVFMGRFRILLGDDSLLALAGGYEGKAVQQLSAFGLTMWPETMGWHLRQRLRWARGRTVRNFWRLKYYPIFSYIWVFTVGSIYGFFVGMAALVFLILHFPQDASLIVRILLAMIWLSWLGQLRVLCFKRSDETWVDRAMVIAIRPIASLWASVVLSRLLRAAGMMTFLKQGWTTRRAGAELSLAELAEERENA